MNDLFFVNDLCSRIDFVNSLDTHLYIDGQEIFDYEQYRNLVQAIEDNGDYEADDLTLAIAD